jgi:hypothetical protein
LGTQLKNGQLDSTQFSSWIELETFFWIDELWWVELREFFSIGVVNWAKLANIYELNRVELKRFFSESNWIEHLF